MTLERSVARLLRFSVYAAVALLGAGVVVLLLSGISPLSGGPGLDVGAVPGAVAGLRAPGLLWLGLLVAIATPSARVVVALFGYLRSRETTMAFVSILILIIIAASVALTFIVES